MSSRKNKKIMNYKFKTKPYEHQLTALEKSWDKEDYAYFMEMGTGKSKVLVDNIAMLYDKGKINSAVIIAPKGVYRNWYSQEIPNHMPGHIDYKSVLWTASTSKKKDKEYQQLFKVDYDLHILVMNVEAFSTKRGQDFALKFMRCHDVLLAVDESTTIKTPTAKRTKAITVMAPMARYRRILTGSPVTKSPLDLFTQCQFLSPELLGFSSYLAFRNRYAEMTDIPVGSGRFIQVPKYYKRLEELEIKLKQFATRIRKDQCLDLKPKVRTKRYIELEGESKKIYDRLRTSALAIVEDSTISFSNKLTDCKTIWLTGLPASGKSTISNILKIILKDAYNLKTVIFSIDDFYKTFKERKKISRKISNLFLTRGVPGTHDTKMLLQCIKNLKNNKFKKMYIPKFDKSIDDRLSKRFWQNIKTKPDIVIFEGWCVGASPQTNKDLIKPVNVLEKEKDKNRTWRNFVKHAC